MIKTTAVIYLFLLCNLYLHGQNSGTNPATNNFVATNNDEHKNSLTCEDQFAGNLALGTVNAQSDEINLNTSYLCWGDEFEIVNSNANLSGDPEPQTAPGIAYVFYDCPPTISGPTKVDLLTDACLNQTDPIVIGGVEIALNDFWIVKGEEGYGENITFTNNGVLQEAYNDYAPVQFWFAPLTLHDFATGGFEQGDESCLHVNVDEAFSVVYLNEIQASGFQTNVDGNACTGSFLIEGGLPEFNGLLYASITITKTDNPDVTGVLGVGTVSNTHGDLIKFQVYQPGEYTIEVWDNLGCGTSFTMNMGACPFMEFTASDETINSGEEACFSISVENFTDVVSMQFSFNYNSDLLQFNTAENFNLPGFGPPNFNATQPDAINFSWFDYYLFGQTVPDHTVLFDLCFTVLEDNDFETILSFGGNPTALEAIVSPEAPYGMVFNHGNLIQLSSVGVDEMDATEIDLATVSPNPFRENPVATVFAAASGGAKLQIYHPSGQKIMERDLLLKPGENAVPLNGFEKFSPGMYMLQIVYPDDRRVLCKLVKI